MLYAGYSILGTGCRIRNSVYPHPASSILHPASSIHYPERGTTLVELLAVLAVIGVIMSVMAPHLRGGRQVWKVVGDRHPEVLQNARIGMDKMTRDLRQAQSISDAGADYVEFVDNDEVSWKFQLNSGYLEYGLVGSLNTLAGTVNSLSFTYYEEDGNTVTTTADDVRSVLIQMTTYDSEGVVADVTLSSRVFIRKDDAAAEELTIVINEIMYAPSGNDSHWEWVEFHNPTGADIDLAGWDFDSKSIGSLGSTVITAGGYATISRWNSPAFWSLPSDVTKLYITGNLGLGDSGDTVSLEAPAGVMDSVTYNSSWPAWSSTDNYTLERLDAQGDSNDPDNWERGPWGGTPGLPN